MLPVSKNHTLMLKLLTVTERVGHLISSDCLYIVLTVQMPDFE